MPFSRSAPPSGAADAVVIDKQRQRPQPSRRQRTSIPLPSADDLKAEIARIMRLDDRGAEKMLDIILRVRGPPNDGALNIMRRAEVERRVGLKKSSIYRLIEKGEFPKPVHLTPGCAVWFASEVEGWLEARLEGALTARGQKPRKRRRGRPRKKPPASEESATSIA
jgi:prophage regulatory protein